MMTCDRKINVVIFPDYHLSQTNTTTPDNILRIYHYLEELGLNAVLLDYRGCKSDEELERCLSMERHNCIWFLSAVTCQADYVNTVSLMLKHISLNNVVVLGGRHVTSMCASGENMFALHDFVDIFFDGFVWNKETMREVYSIVYAYCHNTYRGSQVHKLTGMVTPEDIIVPLPYEVLGDRQVSQVGGWLHKSEGEAIRVQNMMASVGCAFKCGFCDNPFRRAVSAPVEAVVAEIRRRRERYRINGIKFDDDDMFQNINWNEKFLTALEKESLDIKYLIMTRCDIQRRNYIKLQQIKRFEKLGLRVIGLGVECPDDRVLKTIKKGVTVAMIKDTIQNISDDTSIELLLYMIYGLPPLDREAVENTKHFIEWCRGKVKHMIFSGYTPLPNTPLYKDENLGKVIAEKMPVKHEWDNFYFFGCVDSVKYLPTSVSKKQYLQYKFEIYRCLNDNGFLREETKQDIIKAGYKL